MLNDYDKIKASIKTMRNGMIFSSLLALTVGIIFIAAPTFSKDIICYIIAGVLAVAGIYTLIYYFVADHVATFGSGGLVKGITCLIFGVVMFARPELVTGVLSAIIAIVMMIDAVMKVQYSVDLYRAGSARWWYLTVPAGVIFLLGLIILFNPAIAASAFMVFIGVSLIIDGLTDLFSIYFVSKCIKDVYESEEKDEDEDKIKEPETEEKTELIEKE